MSKKKLTWDDQEYRADPRMWTDTELASELRFHVRFKGEFNSWMILCEAIARVLEKIN
jgi:hypothetical protein